MYAKHGRRSQSPNGVNLARDLFKGLIDEFRIFVSKTDASGALSQADINSYYMEAFTTDPVCGDAPKSPPPRMRSSRLSNLKRQHILLASSGLMSELTKLAK